MLMGPMSPLKLVVPRRLECPRCTTCLVSHDLGLGLRRYWVAENGVVASRSLQQRVNVTNLISKLQPTNGNVQMHGGGIGTLSHCPVASHSRAAHLENLVVRPPIAA
jgi:hypothetical protein